MVIKDPSSSFGKTDGTKSPKYTMATVQDRLLAFVVDALILSPVLQLLVSPISRKIEMLSVTMPDSTEAGFFAVATLMIALFVICMYQTFCLSLWGATPGKKFLKLRVVSVTGDELIWSQCLLRSVMWIAEVAMIGLPFLEVFGHKRRRPLHDRSAETQVVSEKALSEDSGPHRVETHFVRQLILAAVLVGSVIGTGEFLRLYYRAERADFRKGELMNHDYFCSEVSEDSEFRLDEAIALFVVGESSTECLKKEANFALWTVHHPQQTWGYLAMALINTDDKVKRDAYTAKICGQKGDELDREACSIASAFAGSDGLEINDNVKAQSLTAKVLQLEWLERSGRFKELQKEVESFPPGRLKAALSGYFVRALWAQHDFQKSRGALASAIFSEQAGALGKWAGWACLAEMENGCEQAIEESSCQYFLKSSPKEAFVGSGNNPSVESIWAEVKLSSCTHRPLYLSPEEKSFANGKPDLLRMIEIFDSSFSDEKKAYEYSLIAKKSKGLVFERAVAEWAALSRSRRDYTALAEILAKTKRHDEVWQGTVLELFSSALENKEFVESEKIGELLPFEIYEQWGLEKSRLISMVKADKIAEAKKVFAASALSKQSMREPAATDAWSEIKAKLSKAGLSQ